MFFELIEGVGAMRARRVGKISLRSYQFEPVPLPKLDSKLIPDTPEKVALLARKLRINQRTLEKWEPGRAKPNPQAGALVLRVRR
jgi:putative transcriptional regulator